MKKVPNDYFGIFIIIFLLISISCLIFAFIMNTELLNPISEIGCFCCIYKNNRSRISPQDNTNIGTPITLVEVYEEEKRYPEEV